MPPKKSDVKKPNKKKLISEETKKKIKSKTQKGGKDLESQDESDASQESEYTSAPSISSDDTIEYEENIENTESDTLEDGNIEIDDEDVDDIESVSEAEEELEASIEHEGDECMYRFTSKKAKKYDIDDADYDEGYIDEETTDILTLDDKHVPTNKRISKPILTKYERVRALGDRARQLASGAKPIVKDATHMDPKDVARLELKMKVMPIIIERPMPSGKIERWDINELKIVN